MAGKQIPLGFLNIEIVVSHLNTGGTGEIIVTNIGTGPGEVEIDSHRFCYPLNQRTQTRKLLP